MKTALIGHPGVTWRSWLKANRAGEDLLCLDPFDAAQPRPAQLTLLRGTNTVAWRFYGSLDPHRSPHVLVSALGQLLAAASEDTIVQLPAYRPSPLAHQTSLLLAETLKPDRIILAEGTDLDPNGLPVGPEVVALEAAYPPLVEAAQRKARWLRFLGEATAQTINLRRVVIDGTRLGSGRVVERDRMKASLPAALHMEVCGSALFLVTESAISDDEASRLTNAFHCTKLHCALKSDYDGLIGSLARGANEDFAFGVIQSIDFDAGEVHLLSDAVPPAPATLLRIGSVRLDSKGNELAETKPWQL